MTLDIQLQVTQINLIKLYIACQMCYYHNWQPFPILYVNLKWIPYSKLKRDWLLLIQNDQRIKCCGVCLFCFCVSFKIPSLAYKRIIVIQYSLANAYSYEVRIASNYKRSLMVTYGFMLSVICRQWVNNNDLLAK